jgi:hypothetical protein
MTRTPSYFHRWRDDRARVLAIELSPAYVDVAVLRWQNFIGAAAVHEKTGRTFAEVAASRKGGGEPIAAE